MPSHSNRKTSGNIIPGLGSRLREWRKSYGIRAQALAKLIGVSQGSISDIENGVTNPSVNTILKFLKKTGINIHWLLTGETGNIKKGQKIKKPPCKTVYIKPGENVLLKYKEK